MVKEKKTSARVRILLQDVIELRQNSWRKRNGPETTESSIQNKIPECPVIDNNDINFLSLKSLLS